ncbi:MAG: hypothetical protein RLZZ399_2212 [Verrucomicrobiota bacterium]|jgi:hypothetical protein
MKKPQQDLEELWDLFCGATDGTLGEAGMEMLQQRLKQDPEARQLWFEFQDMECGLSELRPSAPQAVATPQSGSSHSKRGWMAWGALAASVAVALGLILHRGPSAALASRDAAECVSVQSALWSSPDSALNPGDGIRIGQVLELFSGSAVVRFTSGAQVTLVGPCIFEVTSRNGGFLSFGQARTVADTQEAKGFILQTPTARVVDVGTEFVTSTSEDGQSRVEVKRGEVFVHVAGEKVAKRLLQGDSLSVAAGLRQVMVRVESGAGNADFEFPSIEPPSRGDYADISKGVASVALLSGRLSADSAPLACLLDGAVQTGSDVRGESVFLQNQERGLVLVDLGKRVSVQKVNTYSWHKNTHDAGDRRRASQKFNLYGLADNVLPASDAPLAELGWELIARVNTYDYFGGESSVLQPEQQASSITSAGALGEFRYLLWEVLPPSADEGDGGVSTFFGEFDVYAESLEKGAR